VIHVCFLLGDLRKLSFGRFVLCFLLDDSRMLSSGWFTGVCSLNANVSERCLCSIFTVSLFTRLSRWNRHSVTKRWYLTPSLLMSYIYGAPCKATNFNVIYMDLRLATLKAVSFYLLHNVSTLSQCRKLSCGTVVCKHFASKQGYPNYRWDLIR
jgi:Mn2+/Fe2+ NRAMP family transporter